MLAISALMGHRHAVPWAAEPQGFVAIVDYDNTECSRFSANVGPLEKGIHYWELEVCLADSGHTVGNLVECAMHFRAPGSLIGLVLMGVALAVVQSCINVRFPLEIRQRTVYERLFASASSRFFTSRSTAIS